MKNEEVIELLERATPEKVDQWVNVYSVYDVKADVYDIPFFCYNDLNAKRHFEMLARRRDQMRTFITDYVLYGIGTYNMKTGVLVETKQYRVIDGEQIKIKFKQEEGEG